MNGLGLILWGVLALLGSGAAFVVALAAHNFGGAAADFIFIASVVLLLAGVALIVWGFF